MSELDIAAARETIDARTHGAMSGDVFAALAFTGWPEALDALEQADERDEAWKQEAQSQAERRRAAEREAGELRERNETLTEALRDLIDLCYGLGLPEAAIDAMVAAARASMAS